ncbi:hypothetical protein [Caulobacter sp. S45]|uniref:hypothetical protein n=1 Tax=Caulobacter sp. S45 TaxID=1641861 RepID=UPI0015772BC1|nr:hypothetical protein [Caulobacter sp. S45]
MILFVNDTGDDENSKLLDIDLAARIQGSLKPVDKTRVEVVGVSDHVRHHPDRLEQSRSEMA